MFSSFNGVRRFTPPGSGLYPFTSHVFTNCGATGRYGPTLAQVQAAYSGAAWAQNTDFLSQGAYQGYQKWTVPETGLYLIEAIGAAGGYATNYSSYPGRGAKAQATILLQMGECLIIVVGQSGGYAPLVGGGGGGTFVIRESGVIPLVVAGGGGGARQNSDYRVNYGDASTSTDARSFSHYPDNRGCPGAGGFSSNGMNSSYSGPGAQSFYAGLVGCMYPESNSGLGGFGGGSCGEWIYWGTAGHGGGFSGGAQYNSYGTNGAGGSCSGYYGCGGGSYATGSNIAFTSAVGTAHGSVTISR